MTLVSVSQMLPTDKFQNKLYNQFDKKRELYTSHKTQIRTTSDTERKGTIIKEMQQMMESKAYFVISKLNSVMYCFIPLCECFISPTQPSEAWISTKAE